MEPRDPYLNLSPLDHRYWQSNEALFEKLAETLSERAAVRYCVRAETALLKIHIRSQFAADVGLLQRIEGLEKTITPEEVSMEEETTQHNIRALVNVIQRHIPSELAPWVHLGATSADILDTAAAMRVRDVMIQTVIPLILDLLDSLIELGDRNTAVPQAGRTHGQLAVPITFGFALAEYISRIGQSVSSLNKLSRDLRGKLSGAVGAYNATGIISGDPQVLESAYLEELGLKCADYANQLVEPEHLLRLLLEINVCFGVVANLADDLRHLQRSEIGEVSESFGIGQVGSSTMPHKHNPWNCEHVKSMWKAFAPRVMTFFMDQISEHQRDLSNSASSRFVFEYIAGFSAAMSRMRKVMARLQVHGDRMQANLRLIGDAILAEPTYILLAMAGFSNAHEIIRRVTLEAKSKGMTLKDILKQNKEVWAAISNRIDAESFYSNPASYCGIAEKKAHQLILKYKKLSESIRGGEMPQ